MIHCLSLSDVGYSHLDDKTLCAGIAIVENERAPVLALVQHGILLI
jgi:hypothetical protein